jgi:hypothetical protein
VSQICSRPTHRWQRLLVDLCWPTQPPSPHHHMKRRSTGHEATTSMLFPGDLRWCIRLHRSIPRSQLCSCFEIPFRWTPLIPIRCREKLWLALAILHPQCTFQSSMKRIWICRKLPRNNIFTCMPFTTQPGFPCPHYTSLGQQAFGCSLLFTSFMCTMFGRDPMFGRDHQQRFIHQFYTIKHIINTADYIKRFDVLMDHLVLYSKSSHQFLFSCTIHRGTSPGYSSNRHGSMTEWSGYDLFPCQALSTSAKHIDDQSSS